MSARTPRFTSLLVPFLLTWLKARGVDPTPVEAALKARRKGDQAPLTEVSLDELALLLEAAARAAKDPLLGLHAAQAMGRGGYGLLEFALRAAPTGRLALERLARFGALINPLVRWSIEVDGDEVSFHHRAPRTGGLGPQGNVFTVQRVLQIAREMLGDDLRPVRAWFSHEAAAVAPELRAALGTSRISFGRASSGCSFFAGDLERRPVDADEALFQALEAHGAAMLAQLVDPQDVVAQARALVLEGLPRGHATLARTAKRLHVTPRTLQRRLAEQGLTFARLLTQVRQAQAERLLGRSDAPLADVAAQLGYAEPSAFVRAFRGWTGTTPGAFRAAEQAPVAS